MDVVVSEQTRHAVGERAERRELDTAAVKGNPSPCTWCTPVRRAMRAFGSVTVR